MKASIYCLACLLVPWIFGPGAVFGQEETVETTTATTTATSDASAVEDEQVAQDEPVQYGPFIDLFGPHLYTLELLDESRAKLSANFTNEVLAGKKVVGLYFSADWCGPCRQFTPELVNFYNRMNNRRGKKDQFEIVWVSRCRDSNAYVQYFAQMPWVALPPEEAMGERGQWLSEKYKTKGIPHLVLLDDLGNTITIDGRTKIPQDKTGIGFPWRSPLAQLYITIFPRSLRLIIKSHIEAIKAGFIGKLKGMLGLSKRMAASKN